MKIGFALFCLVLAANVAANDAPAASLPQPQPLAPSSGIKDTQAASAGKPAAMHRVPAPTISETSVTRQADGRLVMNCVQKPNPKLREQLAAQQAAARSTEPRQP
jgi:hypothetical protein